MKDDVWLEKFEQDALPKIIAEFKPERVLLFGSRITDTANEDSDIDVIIVSDVFSGIPFIKRMPSILKTIRFPKHIDVICYSSDEFERMRDKSSILINALENCEDLKL